MLPREIYANLWLMLTAVTMEAALRRCSVLPSRRCRGGQNKASWFQQGLLDQTQSWIHVDVLSRKVLCWLLASTLAFSFSSFCGVIWGRGANGHIPSIFFISISLKYVHFCHQIKNVDDLQLIKAFLPPLRYPKGLHKGLSFPHSLTHPYTYVVFKESRD